MELGAIMGVANENSSLFVLDPDDFLISVTAFFFPLIEKSVELHTCKAFIFKTLNGKHFTLGDSVRSDDETSKELIAPEHRHLVGFFGSISEGSLVSLGAYHQRIIKGVLKKTFLQDAGIFYMIDKF